MVTDHSDLNSPAPGVVPKRARIRRPLRCAVMLLSATFFVPAMAADAGVSVALTAWAVGKGDDGNERLSAAEQVKPGDVLQYSALYTNGGRQPVRNLVASLPIPVGTELIDAPQLPRAATASIDGKAFSALPLMRKVRTADGRMVDQPVPLAEYRALRWPQHDLASNATLRIGARVRVVATPAASPAR